MLHLTDIHHTYRQGENRLEILRGANLRIQAGEMVALVAPSGTGKSTLLHLAGLLEKLQSGSICIDGLETKGLSDQKRSALRAGSIGFVYQFHHLLPEFTALENIILPQLILGTERDVAARRAMELLAQVGLGPRANHRPTQLSGGEQQRVAILRALANKPKILLADEPTGNLDLANGSVVFDLIRDLARAGNMAVLLVTHNTALAARLDHVVTLQGGQISPLSP
jgi:lipoprotein-releasing system ATP-binding protein